MYATQARYNRIVSTNHESRWSTRIEGNETVYELLLKIIILIFDILWMPIDLVFYNDDYMWWFAAVALISFLSFLTPLTYLIFFQFWSLCLRLINRLFNGVVPEQIWRWVRKIEAIIFRIHGKIMHGNSCL